MTSRRDVQVALATFTVPSPDCVVRYVNGVPHVPVHCAGCGETVRVVSVTTLAGAVAELARLGVHQHQS